MIGFSQKQATGIDISDRSLKTAQLKKKGENIIFSNFKKIDIPEGVIEGGDIVNDEELVKILKKAFEEFRGNRLKIDNLVCNLPEERVFIRVIQLPQMKQEELGQAIYFEAENHIPLSVNEVYLDWQVLTSGQKNQDKLDILIAAAPKNLVENYSNCFKRAGLKLLALEPESLALVRSLIKEDTVANPIVVADIGATSTTLVIYTAQSISFSSRLDMSGRIFSKKIAESLQVSEQEAEKIKIQTGLAKDKRVFQALSPAINDFANQITAGINYYLDHAVNLRPGENTIDQVVLCGGDSLLIGLPEFLTTKLNIPVRVGNPWINISPFIPKKAKKIGLTYKESLICATAFGLALRELKS